jgi:hypothetical protein
VVRSISEGGVCVKRFSEGDPTSGGGAMIVGGLQSKTSISDPRPPIKGRKAGRGVWN